MRMRSVRIPWFIASIAAFLMSAKAQEQRTLPQRPMNVLLIVVDDLGWADLGCYGADFHETPNIDHFCKGAMKFTDAYAAAPVCTPTRAAVMTGMHPARLHMTIWHEAARKPPRNMPLIPPVTKGNLDLHHTTLAEALHESGFYTAHIGKWHLGSAGYYPELQGFDINIGGSFWGCPPTFFYPYRGPFGQSKEMRYVPRMEGGREGEYLTDRLTDEAISIIASSRKQPFFVNLCYYTVHTPIEGKAMVAAKYESKMEKNLYHNNAHYAAMVESLDENIGRLLNELKKQKLEDQTVVVITSDNGGFVNQWKGQKVTSNHPLRSGKGSLYEGGIRVPLLIRWPGVTQGGSVCNVPVTSCDLFATLCSLAGKHEEVASEAKDGENLLGLLKNSNLQLKRNALFWHYPHYYPTTEPVSAIRAGDWKLLEYHRDRRTELYNLKADLSESNNLAAQNPAKVTELRQRLDEWRSNVDAQMPTVNPTRVP